MRNVAFWLLAVSWLLSTSIFADSDSKQLCFDFKNKVVKPLGNIPPLEAQEDVATMGVTGKDLQWSAGHGVVPLPIKKVYYWLLDHTNWKDMTKTKMKVTIEENRPQYLAFHRVDVDVNVWAFITVSWSEEWAYALVKGTSVRPEEIAVSYQIVDGTSHIKQLCGSVYLTKKSDNSTDVYLYEQGIADNYTAKDIKQMHVSNLKTLRAINNPGPVKK